MTISFGKCTDLKDERERTLEFFQDSLDEVGEVGLLGWLGVVDVLHEDGNCLCVRLALELVATLLQDETEFSRVGDDAVMDDDELVGGF